jgi:uncharacterized protein (TIGR02265 family)
MESIPDMIRECLWSKFSYALAGFHLRAGLLHARRIEPLRPAVKLTLSQLFQRKGDTTGGTMHPNEGGRMEEKKAKGTMILDFVKMVRTHKDLDWNKHLLPEDWDIINSLVLPAKWYPLGFYQRCAMAAFLLMAKGDLEGARANGQLQARRLFESTYKSMVMTRDPMRALTQFVSTYGSLFNYSMLKLEKAGPQRAVAFHDYDDTGKSNAPFCSQMQGMFETLIQMTGGKNGKVVITTKQWEGAPITTFEITWD